MEQLEKVTVWYSIDNGGDGSAYPSWYLTDEEADWEQENAYEGWGEPCTGSVETFVGSDIHTEAVTNSKEQVAKKKAKAAGVKDWQWNYKEYLEE